MSRPKSIRGILESTLKGLELDFELKVYSIWGSWREIVGESLARQAQPRSIRNRILFIDVSHSTWVQQLQFLKPNLLEKLNAFLGEPILKDIRFRLGKISPPLAPPSRGDRLQDEDLSEQTLKRIDGFLQTITDEGVRNSVREVLVRGAQLERNRGKEPPPVGRVEKKSNL
jgi:hypothetical protein